MSEKIQTGGGRFDPEDQGKYFLAIDDLWFYDLAALSPPDILIPVDELGSVLDDLDDHQSLLVDSGVFSLAAAHAKKNSIPISQAFAEDPQNVDGWDELRNTYVSTILQHQEKMWGYVELDLGSQEDKEERREEMRQIGISPIPVYSVAGDSWEYFEHLAENYDRICVGSIAKVHQNYRKSVVAAISSFTSKMENRPWVHFLGMSPGTLVNTFFPSSCDSTTWYDVRRFGTLRSINLEKSTSRPEFSPPDGFRPVPGETGRAIPHCSASANRMSMFSQALRTHKREQAALLEP